MVTPQSSLTVESAAAPSLLPGLQGVRWIALEREGERWPFAYVAYIEFGSSEMAGATDPLFGGNDGCNWYGTFGSLEADRLSLGEGYSTELDCGPGTGGAVPQDGDRLLLSGDGSILDVVDDHDRPRLRFVRADRLATATAASHTASRLAEMFVDGPVDAAFSTGADLYFSDEQFVIRLARQPSL